MTMTQFNILMELGHFDKLPEPLIKDMNVSMMAI